MRHQVCLFPNCWWRIRCIIVGGVYMFLYWHSINLIFSNHTYACYFAVLANC
jgi:hypothetical protein